MSMWNRKNNKKTEEQAEKNENNQHMWLNPGYTSTGIPLDTLLEKEKEKKIIQIKSIWYYNDYMHKLKFSINYSD